MPKRKSPDQNHFTYRLELQKTERDALELIAASVAAKNVTHSINNLITPFTQASVAGVAFAASLAGAFMVAKEGIESGLIETEDIPPFLFGIIPGAGVYAARHIDFNQVLSDFDSRMVDFFNPLS